MWNGLMPWDHAVTSWGGTDWVTVSWYRWNRLLNALRSVACLSYGEAAGVLRALKDPHMPLGEAVYHFAARSGVDMDDSQAVARYVVRYALGKRRFVPSPLSAGPRGYDVLNHRVVE